MRRWFGHLDEAFLDDVDDSWLIQLYAFLELSPARGDPHAAPATGPDLPGRDH
jgi:hypothetical protein